MRGLIAALSLCLIVFCVPANADVGNQYDLIAPQWSAGPSHKSARVSRGSVSLSGIVAPLAAKAREISSACGSKVISAVRHTRVRGSGHWSLHSSGRAVDMAGNAPCIYRMLANWPGGYSTDYGRVRHAHISYGGREDGKRFAHGTGGRKLRHAKRRQQHRYAGA